MANTYTQIYLQFIFAVNGRQSLIRNENNTELQKYITGIIQKRKSKLIAINNMPDHIHIFVGFCTTISIANFIQEIKIGSTNFINSKKWTRQKFSWQQGYGGFSYSRSHIDNVVKYIKNQQEHHKKKTFREEYINFLKKFAIEYDQKYLFDFID